MWTDPIVEETRKLREEYAARHDYDIHRIAADLRTWEEQGFPMETKADAPRPPRLTGVLPTVGDGNGREQGK